MAKLYDDKGLLSNLRRWRDCAMMTSEQTSVLHVSHLSEIIAALETVQPVTPEKISPSMAKEKAFLLGAVLDDDEADAFADGWNACCRAPL